MSIDPPKPRRRFALHLSLRLTMALVLLLGGGLGWAIHRAKVQRDAIAAIRAAGGEVYYGWEWSPGDLGRSIGTCPWPRWLVALVGIDFLADVSLVEVRGERVDDALIAQVARLDRIRGLLLQSPRPISEESFARIAGLGRLRELDLDRSACTNPGMRILAASPRLETLRLASSPTDDDVEAIGGITRLKNLTFSADRLTDAGLARLAGLVDLELLDLTGYYASHGGRPARFTSLEPLRGMRALRGLVFNAPEVTSLEPISGCVALRCLYPGSSPITDAGLAPIANFPEPIAAVLESPSPTDAGFASLAGLRKLRMLEVYAPNLTDAGVAALADLPDLARLSLSSPRLTDLGLARLAATPRLEALSIHSPGVTDLGLAAIARHPGLSSLSLAGATLTDPGLASLAPMPSLSSLSLGNTSITDAALPTLLAMPRLINASLAGTSATGPAVASAFAARPSLRISLMPAPTPFRPWPPL